MKTKLNFMNQNKVNPDIEISNYLIRLYIRETGDQLPTNKVFYSEWFSRYLTFIENRLYNYESK